MAYIERNLNPNGKRVGDCVVRAIATVLNETWERVYIDLMLEGFANKDIMTANYVWGGYLRRNGFTRHVVPNTCPSCYTVRDFCKDHAEGRFVLATGSHAVAVIDGNYIDTWDSGNEVPAYFWQMEVINGI